ncbi:MAG: glycosyltransferase family 1 protein [Patescibacteria group bacterium]|jgi:glycosyltransferase involved in cell wall biosynthesis
MKILIDARLYGTKHAGIGRYTQELIKNLETADKENQYVILLQRQNYDEYQPQNPNFKKYRADFKVYGFFEQILLPFLIYSHRPDLVHFPHFNVPLFFFGRYIVTIHDLIVSHYPSSRATTLHPLMYNFKLLAYQLVISRAAKRAGKIIAVSRYTKDDLVRLLKIRPEKIAVIYEGTDLPRLSPVSCPLLFERLGIKQNFLLYVGSAYPHKNLEKLIEAFEIVLRQQADWQLVLAGKESFFYERLSEGIKKELKGKVILPGYLTDEELVCLYAKARLYVFPSLMEGFGLPPLEAQSYGLPVVSANSSCLPEILADSAVYFDPKNSQDMADKIVSVLTDADRRKQLADKGQENSKRFSWEKMAKEVIGLYNSIIG